MNLHAGIIGCGLMGQLHLKMYSQHPDITKITIIDPQYQHINVERELLCKVIQIKGAIENNDHFDLISICTPTFLHAANLRELVRVTNTFLIEKPLFISDEDYVTMQEDITSHSLHVYCALVERHNPLLMEIRNEIQLKGEKITVDLERIGSLPSKSSWYSDENQSGGALWDLGIHDLDLSLWLTGKDIIDIELSEQKSEYSIKIYQENDIQLNIKTGWVNKKDFFKQRVVVKGLEKMISFNEVDLGMARYPAAYYNQIDRFIKANFYGEINYSNCPFDNYLKTFKLLKSIKNIK